MFPLKDENLHCFPPCRLHSLTASGSTLSTRQHVTVTPPTGKQHGGRISTGFSSNPFPAPEPLNQEHTLDPPPRESDLFQDLRLVLKALEGYIDSVLRCQQKDSYSTQWKHYKLWCLEECRHPWVSLDPNQVSANSARDQLMHLLDYISQACGRTTTSATTSRPSLLHSSPSSVSI